MATHELQERTSATYRATLVDDDGLPLVPAQISDLRLTLWNAGDGTVINGWETVPVGPAATVSPEGVLEWAITPDDTPVLDPTVAYERHIARFDFSFGAGRRGRHEVELRVENLRRVA
jgi:hypothetical protein